MNNMNTNNSNLNIDDIDNRLTERLCEALVFSNQIPDGIQLVAILGVGTEDNNREALKVWIKFNMLDLQDFTGNMVLPILQERLVQRLNELYDINY